MFITVHVVRTSLVGQQIKLYNYLFITCAFIHILFANTIANFLFYAVKENLFIIFFIPRGAPPPPETFNEYEFHVHVRMICNIHEIVH